MPWYLYIILIPVATIVILTIIFAIHDIFGNWKESDKLWEEIKRVEGFELPQEGKAPLLVRLPGIRRIRYIFVTLHADEWRRAWGALCLQPRDEWILYAISRGWY
jgi:hypothetical protein